MESKLDISKKEALIILIRFLMVFVICIIAAITFFSDLWIRNPFEIHGILELFCIFIALIIFVIIFIKNRYDGSINPVLGVGFLIVATFNFFHAILYSADMELNEISLIFCFLTRFTENITLLAGTFTIKYKNNTILKLLLFIYTPIILISSIIFFNYQTIVLFFNENGYILYKILSEIAIISLSILVIYRIITSKDGDSIVYHKDTLLAVFLIFFSEIIFSFNSQYIIILSSMGHLMKIVAYCCLFQSFFIESIIKPHNDLKNTRIELQDILNGLPLGIINYNKNKQITFANSAILNLLKCDLDELLNLNNSQLYENFCVVESDRNNTSSRRKSILIKNIEENPIKLHKVSFPHLNGCTETFFDISDEEALNNLKFQTYSILNSINNHVILLDKEQRIVNCNSAAEKFYNTDLKTIYGVSIENFKSTYHFIHEDDENLSEEKDFLDATVIINNKLKHIMFHYTDITDFDYNLLGYIMVSLDMTPSKINEDKWKQQEKLALIGQMGSGIVHEAKNYLSLIRGYCEMLALQVDKHEDMEYVDKILRAANDLNNVVSEFLNLAKPSELIMDILSANEIIKSMDYMLNSTNLLKRTEVIVNLSEEDPDILGDETQLKQVILNLIKNASESMEFTPNPTLLIATRLDKSGNNIEIIIEDNGIGISKSNLRKLGTPFFTTKDKGTGLGLTTCYKMIEDHGGNISVKSVEGLGTTFIIKLPIYEDETASI